MASAFADQPTHFVNFPLMGFSSFVGDFKKLQSEVLDVGLDCKLQTCPHISIIMLQLENGDVDKVDIAIQEVIDDFDFEDVCLIFSRPHILGRCLVLDVDGIEELHNDVNDYIRDKGCTVGQSRKWIAHVTVAQIKDMSSIKDAINHLQFNHTIQITPDSSASLELVKLGAEKCDGFYKSIVSHWMGLRHFSKPPTHKLGSIIGYCCLDKIRADLGNDMLPQHDDDAWFKLSYHYENNLWFYRHVYNNSEYFRRCCKNKGCCCEGLYSDYSSDDY